MNCKTSTLLFFFTILNILFVPSISYAAPIEAHAVYVEGVADYVSIEDSKNYPVELDTPFREGDRIITGSNGKVEIAFDTGALLLLDNDTDVTIRSLNKNDEGTVSAIFYLAVGLIKSSFNKLADNDSIEYHTKTAISGIAGTPEHVIQADVTAAGADRTNVYLLGEAGDEGSLFVRGSDPGKTEVTIFAGQGTTVLASLAPLVPFLLGPEILQSIGNVFFHTSGAAAGGTGAATATAATATGISGTTMVLGGVALAAGGAAVVAAAQEEEDKASSGGGTPVVTDVTSRDVVISVIDSNAIQDDYYDLYVNGSFICAVRNPPGGTTRCNATLNSGGNLIELRLTSEQCCSTGLTMTIEPGGYSSGFSGTQNHSWTITAP